MRSFPVYHDMSVLYITAGASAFKVHGKGTPGVVPPHPDAHTNATPFKHIHPFQQRHHRHILPFQTSCVDHLQVPSASHRPESVLHSRDQTLLASGTFVGPNYPKVNQYTSREECKHGETYALGTTDSSLGKNEAPIGIVADGGC